MAHRELSFVVLNIYSVNKDYTDLTNSKQRKKKKILGDYKDKRTSI